MQKHANAQTNVNFRYGSTSTVINQYINQYNNNRYNKIRWKKQKGRGWERKSFLSTFSFKQLSRK